MQGLSGRLRFPGKLMRAAQLEASKGRGLLQSLRPRRARAAGRPSRERKATPPTKLRPPCPDSPAQSEAELHSARCEAEVCVDHLLPERAPLARSHTPEPLRLARESTAHSQPNR